MVVGRRSPRVVPRELHSIGGIMSIQEDCHGLGFGCSTRPGFEHHLSLSIDAGQAPLALVSMR